MCKTCKTRSGHAIAALGGTVLLAAPMAHWRWRWAPGGDNPHLLRGGARPPAAEIGQIWSGSASRINLRKHGVLGGGIEFGLLDHHAARAGRRHLIYGEGHLLNASKSGLFGVQCGMNFSRENAAE